MPKSHLCTKVVNKLAKSIKMNVIRIQKSNQEFTATRQMLNQETTAKPQHLRQSMLNH